MPIFLDPAASEHRRRVRARRQRRLLAGMIWVGALVVIAGVAEVVGAVAAVATALAILAIVVALPGGVRRRHPRRR